MSKGASYRPFSAEARVVYRSFHVTYVATKTALGQYSSGVIGVSPISIIPSMLSTHFLFIYYVHYMVAKLYETLRLKPDGRGIDSLWGHWNFSLT